MTKVELSQMSAAELVRAYEYLVVQQDESFKNERIERFNEQFHQRRAISHELRSRPGDQREFLAALFKHRKAWVRMCVAHDTFVLNEARERMHMQYIADHCWDPYRGEARSALGAWDRGFRPS